MIKRRADATPISITLNTHERLRCILKCADIVVKGRAQRKNRKKALDRGVSEFLTRRHLSAFWGENTTTLPTELQGLVKNKTKRNKCRRDMVEECTREPRVCAAFRMFVGAFINFPPRFLCSRTDHTSSRRHGARCGHDNRIIRGHI